MKALYNITYFNTQRFPYAQIGIGGNTLVTGTNGVGKTTTAQSILFFYGSTSSQSLGILKNENKDSWLKYSYPEPNSYVFYQYEGLEGDVLLMTYPAGNKIAYRFAFINGGINLKELVLNADNVPKEVKDVNAALLNAGIKLSSQIISPSVYHKVLYGDIDVKKEKLLAEFAPFALMKAQGNYSLIPDVLSSIFLNSKIDSGSIENAIAGISSRQTILDLSQLREQVQIVTESYDAIMVYDSQKGEISKILQAYSKYNESIDKTKSILLQLYAAIKHYEQDLPIVTQKIEEKKSALASLIEEHSSQRVELSFAEKEASRKSIECKNDIKHMQYLKNKYNEEDMQKKALLIEGLEMLRNEQQTAQAAYDSLSSEHQDLQRVYDLQIEIAKSSSHKAQSILNEKFDTDKKILDEKIEYEENKRDSAVNSIEDAEAKRISLLLNKKKAAWDSYLKANDEKHILERTNPFSEESNKLSEQLKILSKGLDESKNKITRLAVQLTHNAERQEECRKSIEKSRKWANERVTTFQESKKPELKNLERLLNIESSSVLGFIRENISDSENILTAVLKDEVLLREDLNPLMGDNNHTLYGMSLDTETLSQSEYSHEALSKKIAEIKKEIEKYKDAINSELEAEVESISLEEKKLRKEYFSRNEEKTSLENFRMHDERNKVLLQEQYEEKLNTAVVMWDDAKVNMRNVVSILKSAYDAIESEHNNAQNIRSASIASEKEKFRLIIELLKTERREIGNKKDSDIKTISRELKEKIDSIEKERLAALENDGVSKEELEKILAALKKATDFVREANSYIEAVAIWRNDKTIFDTLPELIESGIVLENAHRAIEAEYNKEKLAMELKERSGSEEIIGLEKKIGEYNLGLINWQTMKETNRFRQIVAEVEQCSIENIIISGVNPSRLHHLAGAELENADDSFILIDNQFKRFVAKLSKDRYLFFKYDDSSKQGILGSAKDLKIFIEEGGIDTTKELIAKEIRQIQGNVSERYENLHDDSEKIKSLVIKINKVLKGSITNIPVLQEVEMRYMASEHKVLSYIEAISKVDIPYGNYSSLFSDAEKSKKSSDEILKLYKQLIDEMGHEKRNEITVKDTFEVQFRVIENNNDSGWVTSRKEIGSRGTSVIIKTLTYVALLDTILTMTRKNSEVSIHVLMDEIGTLSQNNMKEIINMMNNCGIILFSAAPDARLPHLYTATYKYELINTKSKIILAAVRR